MSSPTKQEWEGAESARRLAKILFDEPGAVREIRALRAGRCLSTGYFNNVEDFVRAAGLSDKGDKRASGTFVTLNPTGPDLLARAENRIKSPAKETTSDQDIVRRRLLLIDLDADRPSGISATDKEKRMANERAGEVCRYLDQLGFPEPAKADSGNGAHLLYRIDLPADDDGLIKRTLEALAFRFDDDAVHVDQTVYNPARITKLYGTMVRKGDSTDDRPHRRSKLFYVPEEFQVVPEELLRRLAAMGPPAKKEALLEPGRDGQQFDVEAYLVAHQVEVLSEKEWQGGWVWVLGACVWDPAHDDASAYVIQFANGAIAAGCHHNSCSGRRWPELRDALEPDRQKRQKGASGSSVSATPTRLEDWPEPEPVPDDLPPVLPFDAEVLPEALRPRVLDIAERFQCPVEYVAAGTIVSAAGLIGRRVGIRPKAKGDWLVVPNLFGMVIGRPGQMKSPAVGAAFKPLKALEQEARAEFDRDAKEHEARQLLEKARSKIRFDEIQKAVRSGSDASALAREEVEGAGDPPTRTRYLVYDSTVEKLGELLAENPQGLTVYRDEIIGLIRSMEREGHEQARAFYLEGWNGDQSSTVDRIGRGTIDIPSNTLSVFGCIQPGPLRNYMLGTLGAGAQDDGFLQRFQIAVYPDSPKTWTYVDRPSDKGAEAVCTEVYQRLSRITRESVQAEGAAGGIPYLRFNEEAQAVFVDWLCGLELRLREDADPPVIESHLAKYRSLVPSIALVNHLIDSGAGPVGVAAVRRAIAWAEILESHARRIFHCALHHEDVVAKLLSKKILSGALTGAFTIRDVYRKKWSGLSERSVVLDGANALVDLGWLHPELQRTAGRPSTVYRINPRILQMPGEGTAKSDGSPSGSSVSEAAEGLVEADEPGPTTNEEEAA